jgi:hypothetical protein
MHSSGLFGYGTRDKRIELMLIKDSSFILMSRLKSSIEKLPLIAEQRRVDFKKLTISEYEEDKECALENRASRIKKSIKKRPLVIILPIDNERAYSGSLCNMFNSEMFGLPMLMHYYFKKFDHHGIHTFLTNKLFTISNELLEFYIP